MGDDVMFAPLQIPEAGEKGSGERETSLPRGAYDVTYRGMTYGLKLDTTVTKPRCA